MSPHSEDPDILEYKALFQMLALVSNLPCRDCSPLIYRHPQEHLGEKTPDQNQPTKNNPNQQTPTKAKPNQNPPQNLKKETGHLLLHPVGCSAGVPLRISAELLSGKNCR